MTQERLDGLIEASKAGIVALAASGVLSYPIYRLLLFLKSRQTVSEFLPGHQSKQGTPTMGGLIVIAGFIVGSAYSSTSSDFWALMALFGGFAAIGFLDDFLVPRLLRGKRGLGWMQKLLLETLVIAGLMIYGMVLVGGPQDIPLNIVVASIALPVFVILFYANAYNFSDGLDGLAGYIAVAWIAGFIGLYSIGAGVLESIPSGCVLLGALIPFLILNTKPAKIFMGDVGSLPIGAILGTLLLSMIPLLTPAESGMNSEETKWSLIVYPWQYWVAFVLMSTVMIMELVPVALQIISVKIWKKRLFLMTPIHHALEKKGWPESRIVLTFALIQLICSIAAVVLIALVGP